MYRLIVLFAILTYAEPCLFKQLCKDRNSLYCHFCLGPEKPNIETSLQTVERECIEQDEKFLKVCTDLSHIRPREMYGTDMYFLTYSLPAKDLKVTVQIKHKFIHSTFTQKYGSNAKIFEDVKILPDMVKPEDAVYTIQNKDLLKITIPYKVPLGTEVVKDCGVVYTKNVVDVPAVKYTSINYRSLLNKYEAPRAKED